jgi:hypothetical protein
MKRRWRPLKLNDNDFFSRVYKLEPDSDDWGSLTSVTMSITPRAPGAPPAPASTDDIKYDYARRVMTPGKFYSVPTTEESLGDGGEVETVTSDVLFQALQSVQAVAELKNRTDVRANGGRILGEKQKGCKPAVYGSC